MTNLNRTTSFIRCNVNTFFDILEEVMDCYKFDCSDIYNVDDMSITIVQQPDRMTARKDVKLVGLSTLAEHEMLVRGCA